jgi:Na+-driven multidrug efflux pump
MCFRWGFGVAGLWWGLSAGLMICGVALLAVWAAKKGTLLAEARTHG